MVCIYTDHPSIHPLQAAVMIMIMIMIIIIVIMTIRAMACHIISYHKRKRKNPLNDDDSNAPLDVDVKPNSLSASSNIYLSIYNLFIHAKNPLLFSFFLSTQKPIPSVNKTKTKTKTIPTCCLCLFSTTTNQPTNQPKTPVRLA